MKFDIIKEAAKSEEIKDLVKDLVSAYEGYDNDVFRNQAKHKADIAKISGELVKYVDVGGEFQKHIKKLADAQDQKEKDRAGRALVKYYNENYHD